MSKAFAGGGGDRVDPPAPAVAVPNICDDSPDFDLYYVVPKPSSVSHGVSYLLQEFGILLADTLKIPRDSYGVEGVVLKEMFFDEANKGQLIRQDRYLVKVAWRADKVPSVDHPARKLTV